MRAILKFCLSTSLLLCFAVAQAQIVYNFPGFNSSVHCTAEDSDYLYIGGGFNLGSDYSQIGKGMLTVSTTGTGLADNGFPGFNGTVNAILDDGNGGWFIGGSFTKVGTLTRNRLVHILADKTIDSDWAPNVNSTIYCLAISGTDLYVGGNFTDIGGQTLNRIAKLSTTGAGTADATWNPNVNSTFFCLALSSTDLYIGGSFTTSGGLARNNIAKLSTTGTGATDAAWNPNANDYVYSIVISGTDLYVGGEFSSIGGQSRNRIAKLSTTGIGAADAVWNPNSNYYVYSMVLLGTDLYVGGDFTSIGGQSRNRIARLSTTGTGTADAVWNPNAGSNSYVYSIALSGTDLYVSGIFTSIGGQNRGGFARIATTGTGTADAVWVGNNYTLSSTTRNSILVSGNMVFIGTDGNIFRNSVRSYLVRMSKTTNLIDATWNPSVNGFVSSLAISGTDLYVGGDFTNIAGQTRNRIAKISTTTALVDPAWNPDANKVVYSLALSGTDLYVGGDFSSIGGQSRNWIAKLSTTGNGAADADWNPNGNGNVRSIAISGTDLYVGGSFTNIGGQTRNRIAKLSTTGAGIADATWNPNASSSVYSLALSGTDLYVGGSFTSIGGQTRNRIAKLDATGAGTANFTWNPNANDYVLSLALSGADLYVGGFFTSIGGQTRNYIAKLGTTGTGTADPIWNPNASNFGFSATNSILQSGTNVYLGGSFNSIQGVTAYNFAVVPTVLKITQYISFSSLSTRFFGGSAFNLFATGGASGNPITYTSSNPAVATISGNTVTIIGLGNSTITASQAGNVSYNAATDVAQLLTVNKGNQTITFSLGANAAKTIGNAPFTLSGTASSGLAVSYTSSNPAVATVSGNIVTIVGVGITTITAYQAGNTNYNASSEVFQTLRVNKVNQSITFSLGLNTNKKFGDPSFTLSATGGASGNPVTFSSSNILVATISDATLTIVGVGTAIITASQFGNTTYSSTITNQTLTVNKGSQTISFSLGANTFRNLGNAPFALTATASSGLAPTYTSSNSLVAAILGDTVFITGAGRTTITASQKGNANYNAATDMFQMITVNPAFITALEDLEDTDILVYPNPATDLLTIDIGDAKDCSIAIIDSEGKLVSSGISTQGNGLVSVSVAQLPAGIYTLQISKKGETTNKRFVKQ